MTHHFHSQYPAGPMFDRSTSFDLSFPLLVQCSVNLGNARRECVRYHLHTIVSYLQSFTSGRHWRPAGPQAAHQWALTDQLSERHQRIPTDQPTGRHQGIPTDQTTGRHQWARADRQARRPQRRPQRTGHLMARHQTWAHHVARLRQHRCRKVPWRG
jgi:hypothetical protein